jgi:hypothetical protein
LTIVGCRDTIRVEVMRMTYRQIRGFKTWLEDVAGTSEALEWARGLGRRSWRPWPRPSRLGATPWMPRGSPWGRMTIASGGPSTGLSRSLAYRED